MTGTGPHFTYDPMAYIDGPERPRAIKSLRRYFCAYTGAHFERIADANQSFITEKDLIAVNMLGVGVPARQTLWILGEGRAAIADLLNQVPSDEGALRDPTVDLGPDGPACALYKRLNALDGIGRTITSKLLAAKRPHLLPVCDKVIRGALKIGGYEDDWAAWQHLLIEHDQDEIAALRLQVPEAAELSLLRTMDAVIWMRRYGWQHPPKHDHQPDPFPPFQP
jgi:Family of unknown function (DUF6308)